MTVFILIIMNYLRHTSYRGYITNITDPPPGFRSKIGQHRWNLPAYLVLCGKYLPGLDVCPSHLKNNKLKKFQGVPWWCSGLRIWPQQQRRWILNPLSEARDWTCIFMDNSQVHNPLSHNGNSPLAPFYSGRNLGTESLICPNSQN